MMFFDENTFMEEPEFKVGCSADNIREYSYFTETAEALLNIKYLNEGFFQDIVFTMKSALNVNKKYTECGFFALQDEQRKLMQTTYTKFANNLIHEFNVNKDWFKANEKVLKKYNGPDVVPTEESYNFTFIDSRNIPSLKPLVDLTQDTKFVADVVSRYGVSIEEKILNIDIEYEKIYDMVHIDQYYNTVRQQLLDTKDPIKPDDYGVEIFNKFRDGGVKRTTPYYATSIRKIAESFDKYTNYTKEVRSMVREIEKRYENISVILKEAIKRSIDLNYDDRLLASYNRYVALKQEQLYKVSGMHLLAFSGKLDAISRSYIQDLDILKRAADLAEGR